MPWQASTLRLELVQADGSALPSSDQPLPVDLGQSTRSFALSISAALPDGSLDASFHGFVRISSRPGWVQSLTGPGVIGRNVLLKNGVSSPIFVEISGAHGPTRIWAEDIGYLPGDPAKPPACADARDNDGDGVFDFPNDPGCAFADDDTEEGGTYATGVSQPIYYALPTVADVQGRGGQTAYPFEQVEIATASPAMVIVTRVSSDGFYVTDVAEPGGFNHLFAYNFNTPYGMRVCDRLVGLTGTVSEFFGFTELGFPSYELHPWRFPVDDNPGDGPCLIPEPLEITDQLLTGGSATAKVLEPYESAVVRVRQATIAKFFGSNLALNNVFTDNQSNCDLNGDGRVSFDPGSGELSCSNACAAEPQCSEWNAFLSRGNFRLVVGASQLGIQANVTTVPGFNPHERRGTTLSSLTGTLRSFSGGALNFTIESRCTDDLVACDPSDQACLQQPPEPKPMGEACVQRRTEYDPYEGTTN